MGNWKRATLVIGAMVAASSIVQFTAREGTGWRVVYRETFHDALAIDDAAWMLDPQGPASPWNVDQFDDDGEAWVAVSGDAFTDALGTLAIYRKRVTFGEDGWLTASTLR